MKDKLIELVNQYPHVVLKTPTIPVGVISGSLTQATPDDANLPWDKSIYEFCNDLKAAAQALQMNCLGLAANQIWKSKEACPAIFVMRWPIENYSAWKWQEVINPKIKVSGKKMKQAEGCLSLMKEGSQTGTPKRRANVTLTYQTLENENQETIKFYGHLGPYAKIVQHEYDHLQGKLCIE